MEKHLICISCPSGCRLTARRENSAADWQISGNTCPRGAVYARQELTDPRRIVTAVVRSDIPELPCVPVRTDRPLPRKWIDPLLNRLYKMQVTAPFECGDILIENFENTHVHVRFTTGSNPEKEVKP